MTSVQPLSIQMLDLQRVFRDFTVTRNLSDAIYQIIKTYNEKKKQKKKRNKRSQILNKKQCSKRRYVLTGKRDFGGYSMKTYTYRKSVTPNLAEQTQANPKKTKTSYFILFFYQEIPCRRIFALTSGNAWSVVRPYVNYSFPTEVAKKVADPVKIIQVVRRCLFGRNTREDVLHPGAHEFYKTSNLYYLVESFKCVLKDNSSLFHLILDKSITKPGRCWIKVTTGGLLRFGKRLCIQDYPDILDLLAKFVEGKPTNDKNGEAETVDPRFAFLHFLQPARSSKQQLDRLLIKNIYSRRCKGQEQVVDVRHKNLEAYLFSNSFQIKFGSSKYQEIGSSPPTLKSILEKIGTRDEDAFKKDLKEGKLRFTDETLNKYKEKIIDCIEGPLHDSYETYFKIRKMWYFLEADYLGLLCEDFKKLITNNLIAPHEDGQLLRPWKGNCDGEAEAVYCRSYLDISDANDEGYLVFDQITPDYIEPCDILKYTEDTVYLYHVKEEFGQNTRDAASQILNSATMIRGVLTLNCQLPNYLQKLWNLATKESEKDWRQELKHRLESLGENQFYDLFLHRKIVFVYAYLPDPQDSFSNSLNRKLIAEPHIRELINADFLDANQNITGKFYSATKNFFSQSLRSKGVTIKTWNQIHSQLEPEKFSKSTLAKIELVQLAQNLRELNFDFKICEIPKAYE